MCTGVCCRDVSLYALYNTFIMFPDPPHTCTVAMPGAGTVLKCRHTDMYVYISSFEGAAFVDIKMILQTLLCVSNFVLCAIIFYNNSIPNVLNKHSTGSADTSALQRI